MWGAKEPFNNTYGKEPAKFSIGLGGVIKAWDKGLAGLKEGARVMLICPPDDGVRQDRPARHPGQLDVGLRHRRARRRLRRGTVSAAKSERLLNLVILLLVARNYTTKDQIRALMEPYRDTTDEAFDRMFERDKDDLRALGIPLEVGYVDKFFEDEQGYRIKRDAFELPEIDFAADEVAVLGLAAQVWRHAGLAGATSDALVKLKAAGLSFDREQLDLVAPALAAEEPAFEAMWQATVHRTPVRFDYTRSGESESRTRHLQPWGVVTAQGRWYVVGLDTDRGEPADVPPQPDRLLGAGRRRRRFLHRAGGHRPARALRVAHATAT